MEIQMKMPDLATTGSDVRLLRWLVSPGQAIKRGQPLVEIETEKAISSVESIATGVLKEVRILSGAMFSVGQAIAVFEVTTNLNAAADVISEPQASSLGASPAAALPRYKRLFLLALYESIVLILQ